MNTRQAAADRTRAVLIDAGLRLAERTGLTGLSVNLLVEEAGVSKGSFFHHFGDRASYMVALHRDFHERLLVEIQEAVEGLDPGPQRLRKAAETYLDTCLRYRGVRALLLEARAEPAIATEVGARNAATAKLSKADFAAIGRRHPLESARLWAAMTAEAALVELAVGKRNRAVRDALFQYLAAAGPTPPEL